uniref:Probable threonine--tRNA ligase, cytoplasmic n=1 Tax=Grammatophora oceanica TaxID=210454 RepID=A0A7S1VRI6_9STRA|mmetsp:Transcript_52532/g.78487  ORF Transcript_52532/g.78487 Transcript_52532/m.78487 type:complete len:801 (+) Transcript_52532:65-2467(+)
MGEKKSEGEDGSVSLQQTGKFAVLEAPGVQQPAATSDAPSASEAPAAAATKDGAQGRRAKASSGPRIADSKRIIGGDSFVKRTPNPEWLETRVSVFEKVKARRQAELDSKTPVDISVTMPDGNVLTAKKDGTPFQAWKTTPYDVAFAISQGLADSSSVARVTYESFVSDYSLAEDGMEVEDTLSDAMADGGVESEADAKKTLLWDMTRPLVGPVAKLELLKFEQDRDAKTVFWHSSAHMLGEALEHLYGCKLTIGPPLAGGFYYDSYMGKEAFREEDYKPVETEVNKIIKKKQKFERMVITKEEGLELFADNPFKVEILTTKVPDGSRTTVYKCGDLIDLCRGPHVPHTGKVKAFATTRHSATQWLGDTNNETLQRMYGISFPDKKQLKVWKENQEKAKERDHRRIAQKQELVMFHDLSPGSAFWLPHGTRIYNKLISFIRDHYWKRGYDEIITPNVYNLDLWHQSGHAMHYKDAMFCFDVEGAEWAMKPMNCPGHCLMFGNSIRSYRDLPLRLADFGVLHRNELSGALTGLTRVRRFQQDDAHIYCREDQIEQEVLGALDFMKAVYDTFGMTYKLELSTRPAKALGDMELWDRAEKALANAMNQFIGEGNWRVNPGDGAFYGPKIDIKVMDAMERVHQCATVQLDFQLPIRFNLQYNTGSKEKGKEFARPVMVHRAMLGSVERMFAVLCEHYGGKWPLWLSPRQVQLIPVHAEFNDYCMEVRDKLHAEGFYVDVDQSKSTFQKKVRNAQIDQFNFQLVVGKQEVANGSVNIRTRDNKVEGEKKVDEMIAHLKKLRDEFK